MLQYKETIRPPLYIMVKNYMLFFAAPCMLLLPAALRAAMCLSPHMPRFPDNVDAILHMYQRFYTSPFLAFLFLVLVFLGWASYCSSVITISIKNNTLFLPVDTGYCTAGHFVTAIPLSDIHSLELRTAQHSIHGQFLNLGPQSTPIKEYKISFYPGYQGDWAVVEFSRIKGGLSRLWAMFRGDSNSGTLEQVRIEFPVENFEEIESIIENQT